MSEQIPKPKFKVGDIIVCNDPVAKLFGVLFYVEKIDLGVRRNAHGNISTMSEFSYHLKYMDTDNKDFVNSARGTIIDSFWDLAPPEVQILYGRMDDKQT